MTKLIDLSGHTYGRLLVVRRAAKQGAHPRWECRCRCGTQVTVTGPALRTGNTRSCGCLKKDTAGTHSTTHGQSTTRTYRIWFALRQRCENKNAEGYANYGGRGIRVCRRWTSFASFFADMGEAPAGMSIDRRNNSGNYTPKNCVWATRHTQNRNKRTNRFVAIGTLRLCAQDWSALSGTGVATIRQRLNRGWPPEAAVLLPAKPMRRKEK